jgi:hypothetical protein
MHNNMQLAYANTIEGVIEGANFVDATMAGLGRGAGNCPMELILAFLHNPKFNLRPVLDCVQNHVEPLRAKLLWGYDLPYLSPDISYSNTVSAATLGSGAHVRALEDRAIPGFYGWKWGVWTGMEGQVLAGKPVHGVPVSICRRGPFRPAFPGFFECPRSAVMMAMRNAGQRPLGRLPLCLGTSVVQRQCLAHPDRAGIGRHRVG